MKIVAIAIFCASFAVLIDAATESPDGASILSSSGEFVPGKLQGFMQINFKLTNICNFLHMQMQMHFIPFVGSITRIYSPIFKKMLKILPASLPQGLVQAMIIFLPAVDEAFKSNDARSLSIWFKLYPTLFNILLPFIVDNDSLKDAMAEGVADSKPLQAQLSKGNLDLKAMDTFFKKQSTAMNDSLNN